MSKVLTGRDRITVLHFLGNSVMFWYLHPLLEASRWSREGCLSGGHSDTCTVVSNPATSRSSSGPLTPSPINRLQLEWLPQMRLFSSLSLSAPFHLWWLHQLVFSSFVEKIAPRPIRGILLCCYYNINESVNSIATWQLRELTSQSPRAYCEILGTRRSKD